MNHHLPRKTTNSLAVANAGLVILTADVTGGRAVDAGRLRMARRPEPLTAVLISVNKHHRAPSGVTLPGLPQPSPEGVIA
jgi:predicted dinucleotide-binding enzyme